MMELILLERVEKLGQMGDLVKVKPGYARNYLLPQKKALRATKANMKSFESQRVHLEAANLERRTEAEAVAAKMVNLTIVLVGQAGETGQLFGSVRSRDISDGVTDAGFEIKLNQVKLERPIKTIGLHQVRIALHPEVTVDITANVARSEEEAKLQATGAVLTEAGGAEPAEPAEPAEDAAAAAAELFENPEDMEIPQDEEEAAEEKAAADVATEEPPQDGADDGEGAATEPPETDEKG